ncbi:Cruciform DNA binding protein [Elasticomyces elasticus]|uniref:Cruciform DNA binding protein n=1 Tax=Exophiala sideris TaxID=1016849 RepID=A0ABR0J0C3_9EURO|nr:Cruciform DNA binding protein [Elasticomyces elasticus]KAK5023682.1 Cruciform DNA binding protein [Exophiala sideris]KAK5029682.1 Cruciform DNA binding protein [Exophiala sideris]KAK5053471.1 Cruciform DNA binding protein [Exophiala sideris]KAK5179229.1 Cruciform DNA binding protein [Eurotiomycetes sp. CCFEE 6388]
MGSFVFKWPHPDAYDVHVTGTFDDWGKTEKLNRVGDIWEKEVHLPEAEKKILYKFVVNDNWVIDPQAPTEDDGHGNVNNVLHPEQISRKRDVAPETLTTSSAAPESTTAAMAGGVPLEQRKEATEVEPATYPTLNKETTKSSLPGAFPETPANEQEQSFSVNPLPATAENKNPVNLPAGEKVPPSSQFTSNSIYSSITTSEQDYDNSGSSTSYIGGALAALGLGGLASSSQPSEKKENLIPESSLPMTKDAGLEDAGPTIQSAGPTSTTAEMAGQVPLEERREATIYEDDSTASAVPEVVKESIAEAHVSPEATTSAEAVREKTAVEEELLNKVSSTDADVQATSSVVPEVVQESIAEAHVSPEAATSTEAVREKTAMEEELLNKVSSTDADAQATSSVVPEVVQESVAAANTSPEAAASTEAVREKAQVEQELLTRVPETEEAGEPAPTFAAATSATAPSTTKETTSETLPGTSSVAAAAVADGAEGSEVPSNVAQTSTVTEKTEGDNTEYAPPHTTGGAPGVSSAAAAAVSDGTEDPTLADEPAVRMMNANDTVGTAPAATEATPATTSSSVPATTATPVKETPKAEAPTSAAPASKKEATTTPSSATTTPTKKPATTTPTGSPASASKDKKKKNRISSLFKKIFD